MCSSDLAKRRCQPVPAGTAPSSSAAIAQALSELPGWTLENQKICKTFNFRDYAATLAFVNAVAGIATAEDHHPDMCFGYNQCHVSYHTHSIGGISDNDFICAAKIEALPH